MNEIIKERNTEIKVEYNSVQFGNRTTFIVKESTEEKVIDLIVHCIKWIANRDSYKMKIFSMIDYSRCGEVQDNIREVEYLLKNINGINYGEDVSLEMWTKW
jgi:hypothetical protein